MKKFILLATLLLIIPVYAAASSITWTSVLLDKNTFDQNYFAVSDQSRIDAWAKVDYTEEDTYLTHPAAVDGLSMQYDGKWSDTEDGFYRFFDLGDDLSSFERDYTFSLDGLPGTEVSMTVPTDTFNIDFDFPDVTYSDGIISWNQVSGADQYRVRLIKPSDDWNWWGDMVFQAKLDSTFTSFQLDEEWLQDDYVLRLEARDYDNGKLYHRSSYFTRIEAAPVPEPSTILLLGSGLAGLAFYRRKRK